MRHGRAQRRRGATADCGGYGGPAGPASCLASRDAHTHAHVVKPGAAVPQPHGVTHHLQARLEQGERATLALGAHTRSRASTAGTQARLQVRHQHCGHNIQSRANRPDSTVTALGKPRYTSVANIVPPCRVVLRRAGGSLFRCCDG